MNVLENSAVECPDYLLDTITQCWAEEPDMRPDFKNIRARLKAKMSNEHRNIMDHMMSLMETYANNLEELVTDRTRLLYEEKQKTEDLLHRMLHK